MTGCNPYIWVMHDREGESYGKEIAISRINPGCEVNLTE